MKNICKKSKSNFKKKKELEAFEFKIYELYNIINILYNVSTHSTQGLQFEAQLAVTILRTITQINRFIDYL